VSLRYPSREEVRELRIDEVIERLQRIRNQYGNMRVMVDVVQWCYSHHETKFDGPIGPPVVGFKIDIHPDNGNVVTLTYAI
jgi:hypothetical protein